MVGRDIWTGPKLYFLFAKLKQSTTSGMVVGTFELLKIRNALSS